MWADLDLIVQWMIEQLSKVGTLVVSSPLLTAIIGFFVVRMVIDLFYFIKRKVF